MKYVCTKYNAPHWKDKKASNFTMANMKWESCCKKGKLQITLLNDPPELLKNLRLMRTKSPLIFLII